MSKTPDPTAEQPPLQPAAPAPQPVAPAGTDPERYPVPEYDSAIARGKASFAQLAETWFGRQAKWSPGAEARQTADYYYKYILAAFEREYGGISQLFWCTRLPAGVVLTDTANLEIVDALLPAGRAGVDRIQGLLREAQQLTIQVETALPSGKDRVQAMKQIYSILTSLLAMSDEVDAGKRFDSGLMKSLETEFEQAKDYVQRNGEWRAALWYVFGMPFGLLLVGILLFLFQLLLKGVLKETSNQDLFTSMVAAGGGGALSMLVRLNYGSQPLDWAAGNWRLFFLGLVRPLLGVGFGGGIYLLSASGLIPIRPPSNLPGFAFYAGLGFLVGLSDQLAPTLFRSAQDRLAPTKSSTSTSAKK
jgi:hypothetical protein